jgi:argininosuccinate lyase
VSITELADTLARDRGLPFKTAHAIAASLVRAARARPSETLSALFADASRDAGHPLSLRDDELAQILSPEHFVEIRRTHWRAVAGRDRAGDRRLAGGARGGWARLAARRRCARRRDEAVAAGGRGDLTLLVG